jgi:phage terminase large subunit
MAAITDPEYYEHHLLGRWKEIGAGSVFKNWSFSDLDPDPEAEIIYGLDFGFVDPTALVKISKKDRRIWIQELIYQSGLTPNDLSARMEALGISKNSSIYADSASPMAIEELQRLGWRNLRKANKGPDSIQTGISKIHQYQVFADYESKNLLEEYYNYAYREGTDKPIDKYNHLMDALRYAVMALQDGPKYATIGRARHRAVEDLF